MISEQQLTALVAPVLAKIGFRENFTLHPLKGGANNRVFRVTSASSSLLLKAYFHHAGDQRDRLGAEYRFTRFAWDQGIHVVPQPFVADWEHKLGVYEFIEGRKFQPQEINESILSQTIQFYQALSQIRNHVDAGTLSPASEACFSIADHVSLVQRRIQRLGEIEATSPLNQEAITLVKTALLPLWEKVFRQVQHQLSALNLSAEQELAADERCISPSDFGFHNALLTPEQHVRFIDFEYAGWDDPAKLVCDFFCQPAIPVPFIYFDLFAEAIAASLPDPEAHIKRFHLLLPVYQIKWACIMLNNFLPVGGARRDFALTTADQEEREAIQLGKVRDMLHQKGQL